MTGAQPAGASLLACSTALLTLIAHQVEDPSSLSTFALVSRKAHLAASRAIYQDLAIPDSATSNSRAGADKRRLLLIRTLEENVFLGRTVKRLSTGLVPLSQVTRLLAACPRIRSLRWQIINAPVDRLNATWYIQDGLPPLPPGVVDFDLHQQVTSSFWPGSLKQAVSTASGITSVSLYAPAATVLSLLSLVGPQLRKLSLWVWNVDHARPSASQLATWFFIAPHITHLHLYTIIPDQLDILNLLPNLKKLSFEWVTFDVVDAVVRKVGEDPSWCASLAVLPYFKTIAYAGVLFTKLGRIHWRSFKNKCRIAKLYKGQRPAWKGTAEEIDHLRERIRDNQEVQGLPAPWSAVRPRPIRW